ncbi:hypothetical protein [Methylobacterium pseudosasicola]|nr:hypothetical protein [Methylobacterium pseudosasicola]
MLRTAVRLFLEAEFRFEQRPPTCPGRTLVADARIRVEVNMIRHAVRATAHGHGDELAQLFDEIGTPEPSGGDNHDRIVLGLEQVASQRVPAAPSRRARDHLRD